ncbi:OsmC family protein [Desertivirga arenae]|uniref:OsmC family protein n=1 Tax=Desertivirga arenae TaxID=2810309 RepID=UPI001A975A4C|nr:OsmC family protein [Pedobacter sp. SYSU D00823]
MNEKIIATAIADNKGEIYETDIVAGNHFFIADEPEEVGGQDEAPSPIDYLCASLASCKAITLRMYARRKGWNVESIRVEVKLRKTEDPSFVVNSFFCKLEITGNLTDEQRSRMYKIAEACPVEKLLTQPIEIINEKH